MIFIRTIAKFFWRLFHQRSYCKTCLDVGYCTFCKEGNKRELLEIANSFNMSPTFKGKQLTEQQREYLQEILPNKNKLTNDK